MDKNEKNLRARVRKRIRILGFFSLALMLILLIRVANLTLVHGDEYREKSESKRVREIYTTAPRGEIRDRNGILLAGNKPVFTVQLLKDELDKLKKDDKNRVLLKLERMIEYDGVTISDESPIIMDYFVFSNENDYMESSASPIDVAVERLISKGLLGQYLSSVLRIDYGGESFISTPAERAINALNFKGIKTPFTVKISGSEAVIDFSDGEDFRNYQLENGVPAGMSALDTMCQLLIRDKSLIKKTVDNDASRKLLFDTLEKNSSAEGLELLPFTNSYMQAYIGNKRELMKRFKGISLDSSAKRDFVTIVKELSLKNLLLAPLTKKEGEQTVYPAQKLNEMVKNKGVDLPLIIDLGKDGISPIISIEGSRDSGENAVQMLIDAAEKTDVLTDFISGDDIKYIAQSMIISAGVNPRISVLRDFEYADMISYRTWLEKYKLDSGTNMKDAFQKIREKYSIDEKLSKYEAKGLIQMISKLEEQGQRAYVPINYAYGIKPITVAKIEESMGELNGVNVSLEPVRYYPYGSLAAHVIGHLGRISQPEEIQKYVNEKGYLPSDMLGKIGIEESFEERLKGKNGFKRVQIDVRGNKTDILHEEKPVPGDNVYLSLDLELQEVAKKSLKEVLEAIRTGSTYKSKWGDYTYGINPKTKRPYENATSGAVMAVDVKTGQVLAQATYPSFDPNLFSTGISKADWDSLKPADERDPLAPRPLYNIALQTAVQPGSIFKMVTALAALEKGMNPNETITDMGYVTVGDSRFECWLWTASKMTHGPENLYTALRDSCNYYFYSLALGKNQRLNRPIGVKIDIQDIIKVAREFGLNDKTGLEINIPQEFSGGVPNPEKKIMTMKYLLRQELERSVEKYYVGKRKFDSELKEEIINKILDWTEREEPMTRQEVVNGLASLGLEPEKKMGDDKIGLADNIKYTYLNYAGWNISDTLNVTIGQGQNRYSLAQIVNYIATIANGGHRFKLSYIDNIKNYDNTQVVFSNNPVSETVNLKDLKEIDDVKKGMAMVSEQGTASKVFGKFPVKVAAKTGTAEKDGINPSTGEKYDNFAWMVAFAPYDDPQIAVASIVFQGGSGGYCGPIIRDIIAEYLGLNQQAETETLPIEPGLTR